MRKQCEGCTGRSPSAGSGGGLDGVDPEADSDVPQSLDGLLVWLVVVLHEGKLKKFQGKKKVEQIL